LERADFSGAGERDRGFDDTVAIGRVAYRHSSSRIEQICQPFPEECTRLTDLPAQI